jgi:hypothetical protein
MGRFASIVALALASACIVEPERTPGLQTFDVKVTAVDGAFPPVAAPPSADAPLPANTGDSSIFLAVELSAIAEGGEAVDFDGHARITVEPGAVVQVYDADLRPTARNVRLRNGKATAIVEVTAVYGETRLLVEDLGYTPAEPGETPACANGENDDPDEDVFVDFPTDPGCAFANDDSEELGSFSVGTSPPLHFALPTLRQVQGAGSATPYAYEGIEVKTDAPQVLVVTRIAKDGFYVTDLADQDRGHNHMFAFSFSTPPGLRVCDRVTYLTGTLAEFFGFTEMNFPSFEAEPLFEGDEERCLVPEPVLLDAADLPADEVLVDDPLELEKQESGLVRIRDYQIAGKFGPKLAMNNRFEADRSNCDLNGDGRVDFESEAEASCSNVCSDDPDCTEWTQYISRGSYKVRRGTNKIMIQTAGAAGFNPVANRGAVLTSVSGTLRNFSGGDLNWTIETRCTDDLVCDLEGCSSEITPSNRACVSLRTEDDNDEGTN